VQHGFADRLAAVADFRHHGPLRLFFQDLPQPVTNQRVIISEQES
jgi:hypothetical protein